MGCEKLISGGSVVVKMEGLLLEVGREMLRSRHEL